MTVKRWTRSDFIIMGILFALLIAWGPLVQWWMGSSPQSPERPAEEKGGPSAESADFGGDSSKTEPASSADLSMGAALPVLQAPVQVTAEEAVLPSEVSVADRTISENLWVLSNELVRVAVSRIGAGVVWVEMIPYPESPDRPDRSLRLDFCDEPALSLSPPVRGNGRRFAFDEAFAFEGEWLEEGRSVRLHLTDSQGLRLERTLTLEEGYQIVLKDRFVNTGSGTIVVPEHGLRVGPLGGAGAMADARQGYYLGVDTLSSSGGADVHHWGGGGFFSRTPRLAQFFQPPERRGGGCESFKPPLREPLPREIRHGVRDRTDWLAAKNKFFTQILVPREGSAGFVLRAERIVPPTEDPGQPSTWMKAPVIARVAAEMTRDGAELPPGGEAVMTATYYAGPKEYRRIADMGNRIVEIMEFGRLRPLCRLLLVTLNALYAVIPNYGVAIILLTLLLRLIFWPITHKSTESMRKMQEIQPLLTEIRERYKGKPQKIQEETMRIYREHKVNPMGGCLPMLIQIPVFIALFNVLRSAVELRYASFLWVRDLSEPENLFAGQLPFGSGLNVLPLIMTATSIWQSHLSPGGGDPAQQRMMTWMMPLMMLFIFYNMPSALVLYWTANQVIMIVQMLWQKRLKEARSRS